MLLWHGSRLTNWAGILSQGSSDFDKWYANASFSASHNWWFFFHVPHSASLYPGLRIAPPEAPVTGYMFGKGVYFADMFSKSANYCFASSTAPTGVLLLCEVVIRLMQLSIFMTIRLWRDLILDGIVVILYNKYYVFDLLSFEFISYPGFRISRTL